MTEKIPKHFIDFFEEKGLSTTEMLQLSNAFKKKGITNWKDLVWSLLQELSYRCAGYAQSEEELYREQHSIYGEMLYLRRKYERKQANDIMKLIHLSRIRVANCSNLVMKVSVLGGDKRCNHSFTYKDKIFTMEEALEDGPVDMSRCENPMGCTCSVTLKAQRDKNGALQVKK